MANDIATIISQVGFPIAACGAMAWYVKYITDRNFKQSEELSNKYSEALNEVKEALYQQTAAITTLTRDFGKGTTERYETLIESLNSAGANSTDTPAN